MLVNVFVEKCMTVSVTDVSTNGFWCEESTRRECEKSVEGRKCEEGSEKKFFVIARSEDRSKIQHKEESVTARTC